MAQTIHFQLPVFDLTQDSLSSEMLHVEISSTREIHKQITPLAGILVSDNEQQQSQPFDHFTELQYRALLKQCKVTLRWGTTGDDPSPEFSWDLSSLEFDFGAERINESDQMIDAVLLRGSLILPVKDTSEIPEIFQSFWPFDFNAFPFQALRIEPSGLHVEGPVPQAICTLWQNIPELTPTPFSFVLRCPQRDWDQIDRSEKGGESKAPFWSLLPQQLPSADPAAGAHTLSSIDFIMAVQQAFSLFEEKSWLDNVRSRPLERCHVRFFRTVVDGGPAIQWEALHIGTRISIAAGREERRSAEASFLPDLLAGACSLNGQSQLHPASYLQFARDLQPPQPGHRETRFASLSPQRILDTFHFTLVSELDDDSQLTRTKIDSFDIICHEAPIQRRSAEKDELNEIWCCTQEGWLTFTGSKLLETDLAVDLTGGAAGLNGLLDLFPLIEATVPPTSGDTGTDRFPNESKLLLGSDSKTRIVCTLTAKAVGLYIQEPVCLFQTPRVFLAEPVLPTPATPITDGAETVAKPTDEKFAGADEGLFTSPLSLPSLMGTGKPESLESQLKDRFTSATFVSQRLTHHAKTDLSSVIVAILTVNTTNREVDISQIKIGEASQAGSSAWITHWSDASFPIARTYPDPQCVRPSSDEEQPDEVTPDTAKPLDENRGLHPARFNNENNLAVTFSGPALPMVSKPFIYPHFSETWFPDPRFPALRSFLTTIPGIEYLYPSNSENAAVWSYRYSNPAMDEAYASVEEDSEKVGAEYLFDLNGPDTTRVIYATAFNESDNEIHWFLPVTGDRLNGNLPLAGVEPDFSNSDLAYELDETPSNLKRPTAEKRAADLLPPVKVKPHWTKEPEHGVTYVSEFEEISINPKVPNLVGHGQPLLASVNDQQRVTIQDALGYGVVEPEVNQDLVKELSWQINEDGKPVPGIRLTGKQTLEIKDGQTWSLELSGVSLGKFDTLFDSKKRECSPQLGREFWSLHDGDQKLPALWDFPFLPTRLEEITETQTVIEGILLPRSPEPAFDKDVVSKRMGIPNLNHLPGCNILKVTFDSTKKLKEVSGVLDWRFPSGTEEQAQLERVRIDVKGTMEEPGLRLSEIACRTPVGLVRMQGDETNNVCRIVSSRDQGHALLVGIENWSPWEGDPDDNRPRTKHSVGPFLIHPGDRAPALTPYDFQWITPGGTIDQLSSTVAFGSTPELRQKDFQALASPNLPQDSLASANLVGSPLMTLSSTQLEFLSDLTSEGALAEEIQNLLLADRENIRRQGLFGERIIDRINNWLKEKATAEKVIKLLTENTDSFDGILNLGKNARERHAYLPADSTEKSLQFHHSQQIDQIRLIEPIAIYDGTSVSGSNPRLQGWISDLPEHALEFDQYVQLDVTDTTQIGQAISFLDNSTPSWLMSNPASKDYSYRTGNIIPAHTDWFASLTIFLPDDFKGPFFWSISQTDSSDSQKKRDFRITITKNENNEIILKAAVEEGASGKTVPLPAGTNQIPLVINCLNETATVHINGAQPETIEDWQGNPVSAAKREGVEFGVGPNGLGSIVIRECRVCSCLQNEHPLNIRAWEYQLAEETVETVTTHLLKISPEQDSGESQSTEPLIQIQTLLLGLITESDQQKQFSIEDATIIYSNELINQYHALGHHLPPHVASWILKCILMGVIHSRLTDAQIQALNLRQNWEHAWHALASMRVDDKSMALLGDVVMHPIQRTADEVLFEVTEQVYFQLEERQKLNSHLRLRPIGGFYGAEVHWMYQLSSDEPAKPFLHFQKNAFELQLHLTDRQQRGALAIWTPPEVDQIDRLHIREDSVGEIQAFDGFSPPTGSPQQLQVMFVTKAGEFFIWKPALNNRVLIIPQVQLPSNDPLIQKISSRTRERVNNSREFTLLMIDDQGRSLLFSGETPEHALALPRSLTSKRSVRHLASELMWDLQPGDLLSRGGELIEVISTTGKVRAFPTNGPAVGGTFFIDNWVSWADQNSMMFLNTSVNDLPLSIPHSGIKRILVEKLPLRSDLYLFEQQAGNPNISICVAKNFDPTLASNILTQAIADSEQTRLTTSITQIDDAVALGGTIVLRKAGILYGMDSSKSGLDFLNSWKPIDLGDIATQSMSQLLKSSVSNKSHALIRGRGSETNCVGVLSYSSGDSHPAASTDSEAGETSGQGHVSLQLTGKLVIQNDLQILQTVRIANEDADYECEHRVDLFVDRAEVPVESLFSGPRKDKIISAVAQHVIRFADGKERRWQCPQAVRFTRVGRLQKLLGKDSVKQDDSRLVVDASNVLLLKQTDRVQQQQEPLTGMPPNGGGLLRNQIVEMSLHPRPRSDFNRVNSSQPAPILVRLPVLASPHFAPRDGSQDDNSDFLKRPIVRLSEKKALPPADQTGAQYPILTPSPLNTGPDTTSFFEADSENDSSPASDQDNRIEFLSRNAEAAWLDSAFLGYTLSPENPDRHDRWYWEGDSPAQPVNVLSPIFSPDITSIWPVTKDDEGKPELMLSDLSEIREHRGNNSVQTGQYQGDRITYAAASFTRKRISNSLESPSGPCLFEFPFEVKANRPHSPDSIQNLSPIQKRLPDQIEVQLIAYQSGRFLRLAHDVLKLDTQNDQQDDLMKIRFEQQKNSTIIRWGQHELKRHRRFTGAFVIVDYEQTIVIPPHPDLGHQQLPMLPDVPDTEEEQAQTSWEALSTILQQLIRDPRCRLPLGRDRMIAQPETGTPSATPFAFDAFPVVSEDGLPAPVSATQWRIAFASMNKSNQIPSALTFSHDDQIPLLSWNESVPFEVVENKEFPYPHAWTFLEALLPPEPEPAEATDQDSQHWVRPPRLDVTAWSARPGEMMTSSFQGGMFNKKGSRETLPPAFQNLIESSARQSLCLRRSRAVAAPDEQVLLEQNIEDEILQERFIFKRMKLHQQILKSTLPDATLQMILVTAEQVHQARPERSDAESNPAIVTTAEQITPYFLSMNKITPNDDDQNEPILVLMKKEDDQEFPTEKFIFNNNAEFIAAVSGKLTLQNEPIDDKEPFVYQCATSTDFQFTSGLYVIAQYTSKDKPDGTKEFTLEKKHCWLAVDTVDKKAKFTHPSLAVAVISGQKQLTEVIPEQKRLTGYGNLDTSSFSHISPHFITKTDISWRRTADLDILHRLRSDEKVEKYDIIVTGPAGQTYPTVDKFN